MQDVEGLAQGARHRIGDGMVAADHHRQRAPGDHLLHHGGGVGEAPDHIGRPDLGVADVGDQAAAHLLDQIVLAGLRVVVAGAGGKAQRMLAQRPRPEPRAAHEGRALVGRHAHDRDHGVELRQIGADGRAQEGRDADERELEADVGGGIFGGIGHGRSTPLAAMGRLDTQNHAGGNGGPGGTLPVRTRDRGQSCEPACVCLAGRGIFSAREGGICAQPGWGKDVDQV